MTEFEFQREEDGSLDLDEAVKQAVHEAKYLDLEKHPDIGEALLTEIRANEWNHPRLGLATNKELMDELIARFQTTDNTQCTTEEYVIFAVIASMCSKAQDTRQEMYLPEKLLNYRPVDA